MSARYSGALPPLTILSDFCLLNSAFIVAGHITKIPFVNPHDPQFFLLFNFSWAAITGLTRNFEVSRPLWLRQHVNICLLAMIYHAACLFAVIYFLRNYLSHFPALIFGYALFFLLILLSRSLLFFFLDYIRQKGYNNRRMIVIGDRDIADRLIATFENHSEYGYDLRGYYSEAEVTAMTEEVLFEKILSTQADELFICFKQMNDGQLRRFIGFGDDYLIKIKVVSDLILSNSFARLINYNNLPVLQLSSQPEFSVKLMVLKRGFDIIFSLTALVLGLPVYVLIYLITKVSSPGPAFFKQERIGLNGKPFTMYKFRSMNVDAELTGPQLSSTNDQRAGKWGKFMRKTRLDELPQFWNVLKGDMSIVGPRPERQYFIEKILAKTPNYKRLLRVKPGLTSAGQVNYGYAENVDEMCDRMIHDLHYLRRRDFQQDLEILKKTLKIIAKGEGK